MKTIKAYRCEYCGKVYLRNCACSSHEEHRCCKNPALRPMCYDCQHYEETFEDIDYVEWIDTNWSDPELYERHYKKFYSNKCVVRNLKLYNNIKLSQDMQNGLRDAGFTPMPKPYEKCPNFAPKHKHQ